LTSDKRPDRFLRVVCRTLQACSETHVKAVIAGDGPLKPRLKELAHTLGLSPDKLEFLGELADINSAYQKADILMLTSDWEGTPNVLLEAMAYGLPVIATRVGGVPEIVEAGRGLVTEAEDENGLAAAALRLIGDADLRKSFGERGREYVSKSHSIQALGKRLISTYERVLTG
jgi:glycosyltransferase involved in cell wall biosynthesis